MAYQRLLGYGKTISDAWIPALDALYVGGRLEESARVRPHRAAPPPPNSWPAATWTPVPC